MPVVSLPTLALFLSPPSFCICTEHFNLQGVLPAAPLPRLFCARCDLAADHSHSSPHRTLMIPDRSKNHILARAALKFSLPGNVLTELTNQIPTEEGFGACGAAQPGAGIQKSHFGTQKGSMILKISSPGCS